MGIIDWAKRKLFNQKAKDKQAATRLGFDTLAAPSPVGADANRAERRSYAFGRKDMRQAMRKWKGRMLGFRNPNYPVLAHCYIGACKRLPRYRGMCYTHYMTVDSPL